MSEGLYFLNYCDFTEDKQSETTLNVVGPDEDGCGSHHKRGADVAGRCLQCVCGCVCVCS